MIRGKKKRKRKSVSAFPFVRDPRAEYEKIRPAPKRGSGKEAVRLTLRDKREKERERENAHCGWYLMWPRRPTVTPLYTYLTTLLYNLSLRAGSCVLSPTFLSLSSLFVRDSIFLGISLRDVNASPSSRDDVRRLRAVVTVSLIGLCSSCFFFFSLSSFFRFFLPRCTFTFNCEILPLEPSSVRPNPFHPTTQ